MYFNNLLFLYILKEPEEPKKKKEANCCVCFGNIVMNVEPWRHLHNDFTNTTSCQLSKLVSNIMKEGRKQVKFNKSSVICMACFTLLDRVDEITEQLKVI